MSTEIHCIVSGKVQGVGYRDFVDGYAKDLELTGWIENRQNSSVELVLQGSPEALKESIEVLHEGSVLAEVDSITVDWRTPKKLFDSFKVISS